jgi:signal transduction histidine kinase
MPIEDRVLERSPWQRYLGALLLTLLVVAARAALDPWLGHERNRHLIFLPTVMLAAWFGGAGPGVVSSMVSTLALFLHWSDAPSVLAHLPSFDLVLFLAISVALCGLIHSLQMARARADAAARSREFVLGVVAHDLRNPLTAIKVTSGAIARNDPAARPMLARIDRAVVRMDDLIRDLVDATRIEHGDLAVTTGPHPVEPLLREIAEQFSSMAQQAGVALQIGAPMSERALKCDRGRILQVLGNLIGNALKFTPQGGQVRLTVEDQDGFARFEVADNGSGIAAADLPHVFEPYWKSDQRGTGLGLFIARSIVQAHGGRIWVASAPGSGTRFFFTVPNHRPTAA